MARPGRKKRTALFILEIICLLVFIGGLYVYGQIDSRLNKIETPQLDESKIVTNVTAPQMSGYTTYALFAIDQRSKNAALDAQNSDTIIIASINNDTKEVKLASIYRDTLLDIGNDTYTKANAAYAYGGPEQAISMLNTMLDLNITDYVTVNFNAMVSAVDALGGLDLPLSYAEMVFMNDYCIETSEETGKSYTPVTLPDPKPANEEETLGEYHLNGVQVVSYCRIRYTASMDMGRTERQRRVIGLMVDKAKSAGLTTIFNIMDEVFPMISTSVSKTELLNLIPNLMGYNISDTTGFPSKYKFADVKKASMVVADTLEENVKELHKFLYGADENYQPSQNIVDANAKIIELVGGADTLVDQAPLASNEAGSSDEIVWQGDGSGNYDYNDYSGSNSGSDYSGNDYSGGSDYDSGNDYNGGNDYDSGNDYNDGSNSDSGSDYDSGADYDNGGYDGSGDDGSSDSGFDDGSGYE
ncbi:LCP family glycopolymer transferase [Blautia sp. HCP3S3_H10_1]|uniref:LCP family protein n=1 Tax=unclassified Blautia TaxID=2648079 RepID=UPI003F92AD6E